MAVKSSDKQKGQKGGQQQPDREEAGRANEVVNAAISSMFAGMMGGGSMVPDATDDIEALERDVAEQRKTQTRKVEVCGCGYTADRCSIAKGSGRFIEVPYDDPRQ